MKLEPVGYYNPEIMDEVVSGNREGGVILWARQSEGNDRVPAYTIPNGYVVVPVEDVEDARLGRFVKNFDVQTLELTLERMKYVFSHPEEFPVPPAKEQS